MSYKHNLPSNKQQAIKLTSGSWPPGSVIPVVSQAHDIISELRIPILASDLKYRKICRADLAEFKRLEREWFPFYAGDSFYKQITQPNVVAIGCFWCPKIQQQPYFELLLGAIMVRYESVLIAAEYMTDFIKGSMTIKKLLRAFKFCKNYTGCLGHIMTIGVIDEARRLGIASELMDQVLNKAKADLVNLIGFSLHVIEFNKPAINCYEKNGYKYLFTVPSYYTIKAVPYNGRYYIKPIMRQDKFFAEWDECAGKKRCYEILGKETETTIIVKDTQSGTKYKAKLIKVISAGLLQELKFLVKLGKNRNLVQYVKAFPDIYAKETLIVLLEYTRGTTLTKYVQQVKAERSTISEQRITNLLMQMATTVKLLHSKGVSCRNIVPENIIVAENSGEIKIEGYGVDWELNSSFKAPETVFDKQSDVWSLGCIAYFLCSLEPPFKDEKKKLKELPAVYSWELKEIIKGMLQQRVEYRMSIEMVINLLKLK